MEICLLHNVWSMGLCYICDTYLLPGTYLPTYLPSTYPIALESSQGFACYHAYRHIHHMGTMCDMHRPNNAALSDWVRSARRSKAGNAVYVYISS